MTTALDKTLGPLSIKTAASPHPSLKILAATLYRSSTSQPPLSLNLHLAQGPSRCPQARAQQHPRPREPPASLNQARHPLSQPSAICAPLACLRPQQPQGRALLVNHRATSPLCCSYAGPHLLPPSCSHEQAQPPAVSVDSSLRRLVRSDCLFPLEITATQPFSLLCPRDATTPQTNARASTPEGSNLPHLHPCNLHPHGSPHQQPPCARLPTP